MEWRVVARYGNSNVEVTMLTGPRSTLSWHCHPTINAAFILKGRLLLMSDRKEEIIVKQGDTIVEVVNRWHQRKNIGQQPVEILAVSFGKPNITLTEFK